MKPDRLIWIVWIVCVAFLPASPRAQATDSTDAPRIYEPAPLVVHGVTITTFRVKLAGYTPEDRARSARTRIAALDPPVHGPDIHLDPIPGGYSVFLAEQFLFSVVQGDLDRRVVQTPDEEAQSACRLVIEAVGAARPHFTARQWVFQMLLAAVLTAAAWFLLRLLFATRRRAVAYLARKMHEGRRRFTISGFDIIGRLTGLMRRLVGLATILVGLVLVDVWLTLLLARFPHTQRYGHAARKFIFDNLGEFSIAMLRAAPGFLTAALILVIARFVSRLVSEFFDGVENGTITVAPVKRETAGATKRLVVTLIWLFAVVFAYPFIPGSNSAAFKGLSVFVGLLVTFGSTGVVGHMMSGLVLVYSRALRKGDWVRVGDVEGIVAELGALSTKIVNRRDEEFTIPNTVMVSSTVHNLTQLSEERGAPLVVTLTIGYDAPWRTVHEVLIGAAAQTAGIRKQPEPFVLQTSLSDFYVEYTLVTRLEVSDDRPFVISELNGNIQDACNARGIQIMSPHYESQPPERIVIPKDKWNAGGSPPEEASR